MKKRIKYIMERMLEENRKKETIKKDEDNEIN